MKVKHTIIIFALGFGMDFIGAILKIMHVYGGSFLLIAALVFKVIGGLLFFYKLITSPKLKAFMNS
ncbi:hypothetical protein EZ449_07790 [Pedobacter frigidisoli]|uniref:DoxX-like family protein n=1 Tax=Pedobacter frigidisoli TaxID=2530455 RepID=A0A4R0P5W2_9SPHI|nr:hypothetical protein [Pedobacter frigidisoli]TCD10780.1 hypothetical protein EZ449_07790 [Pedobacter frigidisoli]